MAKYLDVLEQAISDVGYWRWWTANFPKFIQIEFGGTQLWNPPDEEGKPPSGVIALRFDEPVSVSFITHQDAPNDFPPEWPDLLHNGSIEPLTVAYDCLKFNSRDYVQEILREARHVDTRFGVPVGNQEFAAGKVFLAFRAGSGGLIVGGQDLTLLNFQGEIKPEEVEQKFVQWWAYWKEYWKLIDTDKALPKDYACEVIIPAGLLA